MALRKISDTSPGPLAAKAGALLGILARMEGVLVALSGGVDSSLLLAACVEACSGRVLAATAASPIFPRRESDSAKQIALLAGASRRVVKTRELEDPVFRRNPHDRCYHCKLGVFARLKQIAQEEGLAFVIEGSTVDDLADFRPGERALMELGIQSPLRQADFTKADVRRLAREIGLPNWDKAASACLASRVPYGTEITREVLGRIEHVENVLHDMGFAQVRARYYGDMVRLEIAPEEIESAVRPDTRDRIIQAAKRHGFRFVTLDLQGYRTGSLNP
jgi:uncharacterized protein